MKNMKHFYLMTAFAVVAVVVASCAARMAHAQQATAGLVVPSCNTQTPTGTPAGNGNIGPSVVDVNGNNCVGINPSSAGIIALGQTSAAASVPVVQAGDSVVRTQTMICPANPISKKIPPLC